MNFLRISQNHIPNTQGKFNFIHDSYLDNGTAFEISDTIKVSFEIPRLLGVSELVAEIYNENFSNLLIKLNLPWRKTDLGFDKYDLNLKAKALGVGLYFVKLYAKSTYGKIYFKRAKLGMKSTIEDTALFQLTVSDFKYEVRLIFIISSLLCLNCVLDVVKLSLFVKFKDVEVNFLKSNLL